LVILIGFLTGLELPLFIRLGRSLSPDKNITNKILGMDYFGSLIGAMIFPLLLLPAVELISMSLLIALLNIMIAIVILGKFLRDDAGLKFRLCGCGILLLVFVIGIFQISGIQQYFLKKYYYYNETAQSPAL